jgi:hypothetical protein
MSVEAPCPAHVYTYRRNLGPTSRTFTAQRKLSLEFAWALLTRN